MARFRKDQSIKDFQSFNHQVYGRVDDRHYSTPDLLAQVQRFAMRALKGIRKGDTKLLIQNLLIAYSWLNAVANRLSLDLEDETWKRFPMLCSYCGKRPCACKKLKTLARKKVPINNRLRPKTLGSFQQMFEEIYPSASRSLPEAGIHLAEEIGEVAEAVHNYIGEHQEGQLGLIRLEIADVVSCIFGVCNSAHVDMATELGKLFKNNCHVCHKLPCVCRFNRAAHF